MERERPYETGMDEQAKQGSMQNLTEKVAGHDTRNDRSQDYLAALRLGDLHHQRKLESLEIAEREVRLKAEQRNDTIIHMANLKSLTHSGKAFEEMIEKDAEEAKAVSEILSGVQIEAIKSAVAVAVTEALRAAK